MWLGETGSLIIARSIPSHCLSIPVMLGIGLAMERGLIRHFYNVHADQMVTFGLAIVLQEIIKAMYGANPIPQAPDFFSGTVNLGALIGMDLDLSNILVFHILDGLSSFPFLQFTTLGWSFAPEWQTGNRSITRH